jgi:hypothetical protein
VKSSEAEFFWISDGKFGTTYPRRLGCREMVDEEERAAAAGAEEYVNEEDPSILRFLIASRDEASAEQLRDDLLGMLVAGHETTASVLTWTTFLLCESPDKMRKVQVSPLDTFAFFSGRLWLQVRILFTLFIAARIVYEYRGTLAIGFGYTSAQNSNS